MTSAGDALPVARKTGAEKFRDGAHELEADLLSFWQWSSSDLVSNTMRGILAEYVVALALDIADGVRREWDAYDLEMPDGTKIEVKSAAYVQSWYQERPSRIQFGVPRRRAWSAETNQFAEVAGRAADVYVFALLSHTDRASINPLDLGQWEFYVLPTKALDERERSQHSITLQSLHALVGSPTEHAGLKAAVLGAAGNATDEPPEPSQG